MTPVRPSIAALSERIRLTANVSRITCEELDKSIAEHREKAAHHVMVMVMLEKIKRERGSHD